VPRLLFKNDMTQTSSCRACYNVVERTVKNLHLATEVLRQEGLVDKTFSAGGSSCEVLRCRWNEWTSMMMLKVSGEKKFRLASALKGTKTLFDEPCRPCDIANAQSAKDEWARRALNLPQVTSPEVLADIKSRTRWYMGTRWWKEEKVKKRAYVPDQQGCTELERGCGGSLSVRRKGEAPKSEEIVCQDCPEEGDTAKCRVGTAKAKGKVRVVTMQSARAKRKLRPVHEAAYNHLSHQPWLVRGDVTSDHFKTISDDMRPGESFNSGDFEASTDNLNKDAVLAVVEVLAEALPQHRSKVLLDTFEKTWVDWGGEKRVIVRGSMMGNLLSFVVLCLLNKICLDRARQEVEGCGPLYRRALVNGDDLFFSGGNEVFDAWVRATKEVGFVINLKKTMRSTRWGDLNSTTWDFRKSRFVPRLSFGFFGTELWKLPEGSAIDSLFLLVKQVRFSTAAWLLNIRPVQSMFSRVRPALTSFPRRWWQFLVKKRWFRNCMSLPEGDIEADGVERKLPFVLGYPLRESFPAYEKEIARLERKVTRIYVKEWRGRMVAPSKKKVESRSIPTKNSCLNIRLERGAPVWRRLWLEPVLRYFERNFNHLFLFENPDWLEDQPSLQVTIPLVRKSMRPLSFAPPLSVLHETVPLINKDGTLVYLVQ